MTDMMKPDEVEAYLDSVRPMMDEVTNGRYVGVAGWEGQYKVLNINRDACFLTVDICGLPSKCIRFEQIEYIHPY